MLYQRFFWERANPSGKRLRAWVDYMEKNYDQEVYYMYYWCILMFYDFKCWKLLSLRLCIHLQPTMNWVRICLPRSSKHPTNLGGKLPNHLQADPLTVRSRERLTLFCLGSCVGSYVLCMSQCAGQGFLICHTSQSIGPWPSPKARTSSLYQWKGDWWSLNENYTYTSI